MTRRYSTRFFQKVLVPVLYGVDPKAAVNAAALIADRSNILLVGIIGIAEGDSLSGAAVPARHVRKVLRTSASSAQVHASQRIRVSHRPWDEIIQAVQDEAPELLVLDSAQLAVLNVDASQALRYPPCDIVIAGAAFPIVWPMFWFLCAVVRTLSSHCGLGSPFRIPAGPSWPPCIFLR